jgi:hypothetical protein
MLKLLKLKPCLLTAREADMLNADVEHGTHRT